MGAVNEDFYKDSDLKIGAHVNVWGRRFLLCDCDDFTKEYYRVKYGISKICSSFIVFTLGLTHGASGVRTCCFISIILDEADEKQSRLFFPQNAVIYVIYLVFLCLPTPRG